jgi:hypothetical protein
MTTRLNAIFDKLGYKIVSKSSSDYRSFFDIYSEKEFIDIYSKCKKYTMTSIERMYSLYKATEYVVKNKIPGDIVECGVWKGGSTMLCATTLNELGETNRKIYLYDTYTGMAKPNEIDIDYADKKALEMWKKFQKKEFNEWCYVSLEEVQKNLFSTGYPRKNLLFIKGKVEESIPEIIPTQISILRLDTDWYESIYHSLFHLFPKLSINGVILIDDYGHWKGAKEAVDKYIEENDIRIFFNRIDYTGRIGIKL